MTTYDDEHPDPLRRTWGNTVGILATGAAAGVGITVTIYQILGAL
jgi:hypothetical protein